MSKTFQPLHPKVALGVVAHPDDLEFGMGGCVAAWAQAGAAVYYYILTNGNKGSSDRSSHPDRLRDTRRQEQREAARILGVRDVLFGDYEDSALYVTQELKRDIVRAIRQVKPEVVMTFDPTMTYDVEADFINHPDHRAVGQATLDAVFPLARDHLSFPELLAEGLEPHKTATLLLLNFKTQNFYIDISATLDTKLAALAAHASQIEDMPHMTSVVSKMAAAAGGHIGAKYAEAFLRIDVR